jgi:RNA polymerase sigma factor (sigma-70 family)
LLPGKDDLAVPTAPNTLDLEHLAQRMVALEDQAYQGFADYFGPRFRRLFASLGLVASDAEDLAVSCITDIALKVDRYRSGACARGFEGWVLALARNALIDWFRRRRPAQPLLEDPQARAGPRHDPELFEVVWEAVTQLSPDDQDIIHLRDLGTEHSYEEIAQALGIQTGTARTRHKRALQRLESILDRDVRVRSLLDR